MIETPQGRFRSRRQFFTGDRIRKVRKLRRDRRVKILRTTRLDGNIDGVVEPLRQRFRQPIRCHRRQANQPATLAVVGIQRVRRNDDLDPSQCRVLAMTDVGKVPSFLRGADGLEGPGRDPRQVNQTGAPAKLFVRPGSANHALPMTG